MKKYLILGLLLSLVLTIFSPGVIAEEKEVYDLLQKFEEGYIYTVNTDLNSSTKVVTKDQETYMQISEKREFTFEVVDVTSENNLIVSAMYTKYELKFEKMILPFSLFLCLDEINELMRELFELLENQNFTFVLSPEGRILEVNGIQELFLDLVAEGTIELSTAAMIMKFVDEETFMKRWEGIFNYSLEKPVGVGESWTHSLIIYEPVTTTLNCYYTLEKVTEDGAYLIVDSEFDLDYSSLQLHIDFTIEGNIVVTSKVNMILYPGNYFLKESYSEQYVRSTVHVPEIDEGNNVYMEITSILNAYGTITPNH